MSTITNVTVDASTIRRIAWSLRNQSTEVARTEFVEMFTNLLSTPLPEVVDQNDTMVEKAKAILYNTASWGDRAVRGDKEPQDEALALFRALTVTAEELASIAVGHPAHVDSILYSHPNWTVETLTEVEETNMTRTVALYKYNPNMAVLRGYWDWIQEHCFGRPNYYAGRFQDMVGDGSNLDDETLIYLATHGAYGVAGDPRLTGDVLAQVVTALVNDYNYYTSDNIFKNPNLTDEQVMVLDKKKSLSGNSLNRYHIAVSTTATVAVLELLAKSRDSNVRRGLAQNPNTPTHILEKLKKSTVPEISEAAKAQLENRVKEIVKPAPKMGRKVMF